MVKPIIKYISILIVMFFVILFATSKSLAKNKDAGIEKFRDEGFGLFIHWGPVSQIGKEISWPLVGASKEFRDKYFSLYKTFNPTKFNPNSQQLQHHEYTLRKRCQCPTGEGFPR